MLGDRPLAAPQQAAVREPAGDGDVLPAAPGRQSSDGEGSAGEQSETSPARQQESCEDQHCPSETGDSRGPTLLPGPAQGDLHHQ